MTYDEKEIEKRIKARRRAFLIRASIGATIFAVGVIFLFLNERKFIVSGGLLMLLALLIFYKTVNKYLPKWLFSKEIRGKNIKEYEYVTVAASRTRGYRSASLAKTARSANKAKRGPTVHAYVYLEVAEGKIKVLDGITSEHTALYQIGDELLRYSGTRYPIVVSREVKSQPCPLCGAVNSITASRCKRCSLRILSEERAEAKPSVTDEPF